jgi:hypothetical protein
MALANIAELVDRVPVGWTLVEYDGRRYGLTRVDHVGGRSVAIYAEEFGGADVISANVYRTSAGERLNACEMPDAKVLAFLDRWQPVPGHAGASEARADRSSDRASKSVVTDAG